MNIIIFGPPGAGKGTQSKYLAEKFGLYQLSTGEMLRNEIKNNTNIGIKISTIMAAGSLVSDEIVSELIEKIISNNNYKDQIIFDGFPRSLKQAKILENLLKKYNQKIDLVLKLSVTLTTIKKRIFERKNLEKRSDDNEEVAIKRYKMYEKSTEPVIEYYKKLDLLKVIDGERSIEQINKEISDIIALI